MRKIIILFIIQIYFILGSADAQMKQIFRDDFNNNSNNWPEKDNIKIKKGEYNVSCTEGLVSQYAVKKIKFNYYKDYFIETSILQSGTNPNSSGGLIWGQHSKKNSLIFSVSSSGWYKIHGYRDGRPIELKSKTNADSIINSGKVFNKLSIRKAGNKFHFFINGKKVHTSVFYPPFGLNIGIGAFSGAKIKADYILIKAKQKEINLISSSISKYSKKNMGLNINSPFSEIAPVIAPDGKTLYIARADHPLNEKPIRKYDIWYSTLKSDGTWSKLKKAGKPLNNSGDNVVISVSPDNNTLYLETLYNSDGSFKSDQGISVSYRTASGWSVPQKINIRNYYNKNIYESFAFSPNRKVLVLSIERNDGYGDKDMYVSFLQPDGSYSTPKNMGAVLNSFQGEGTPYIAPDNKTMYFYSITEGGYGSADIFVTKRLDNTWTKWSTPKNLGKKINSKLWDVYYTVAARGDYAYLVSAKNTYGGDDIFKLKLRDIEKPDPVVIVYGKVLDNKTGKPIKASIIYENSKTGKSEGIARSNPATGEYKIVLPYGVKYNVRANKDGYFAMNEMIDLKTINVYKEIEKDLFMSPLEKEEAILLKDVHFYATKSLLLPSSYPELNRLVKLMKKYPTMVIEIQGHTETRVGFDEKLMILSEKRAEAVKQFMILKGVIASRIKKKAFGGTKPIADNKTEEGRKLNRRVEFRIIKK